MNEVEIRCFNEGVKVLNESFATDGKLDMGVMNQWIRTLLSNEAANETVQKHELDDEGNLISTRTIHITPKQKANASLCGFFSSLMKAQKYLGSIGVIPQVAEMEVKK